MREHGYNESMALRLWLGNAGSGKSHLLYEEVISEAKLHPERNYIFIVPEQYSLQAMRDLVMLHPDGGMINIDILSFNRLSYRVFEEVGFAKAPGLLIDDMGKNLIIRHLATLQEANLKVIGRSLKRLGTITEIKSVISEFMQYGVDEKAIALLQEKCRQNNRRLLSEKLDDIACLYSAFRNYISEKYTTTEELLSTVSEILPDSKKLADSVIVLDGFTGFTPVQYNLIQALLKHCIDVHVSVLLDTYAQGDLPSAEQELFYLSGKTIRECKHLAQSAGVEVLPDRVIRDEIPKRYAAKEPPMLIHLERNLFREGAAPLDKISDDISIFTASSPLDEMSYVALQIRKLVEEEGYRYHDIAVVSADPETYMHAAKRAFTRHEIPYFVDKKQPVLQNPFIEYLRSILRIITENGSQEAVFSYLKSSMLSIPREEIDLLENYCIACGIRTRKQWMNRFLKCPSFLSEEDLQRLDRLREEITAPFSAFDTAETVRDYCVSLYHMMEGVGAQVRMEEMKNEFLAKGEDVRAREYDLIYPSVIKLLEKLESLLGDEKIDADAFYELLDAGFEEIRVGAIPNRTDYVQIGDLTRSRFPGIRALFFVGVNEGIIPGGINGGGLLTDLDREFFVQSGVEVELAPTVRMQAYTQRLYLYMALTKPGERLFVSYAGVSADGSSMAPSYLITELKELFPGIQITSYDHLGLTEKIDNETSAINELAAALRPLILTGDGEDAKKLLQYFAQKTQYADQIQKLIKSAMSSPKQALTDSVTEAIAHVIYGETIQGSVTRLETYARCAYNHFLHYGLGLKERSEFSFETQDMGSVFHDTLQIFSGILTERNLSWATLGDEEADAIAKEAVDIAIVRYDAIFASFRSSYMRERITRIMKKTVRILRAQLVAGDFVPSGFEVDFTGRNDLSAIRFRLSDREEMRLGGRIDRVDLCEDANKIYVKIIDYKSGNVGLDLAAIYRGEQLQLVVYLNAAMEIEGRKHPDKEIVPAGILYYHLSDPLVDGRSDEADDVIRQRILSKLRMNGLVNAGDEVIGHLDRDFEGSSDIIPVGRKKDGSLNATSNVATSEEFDVISNYVNHTILKMGREMLDGNIAAKPGNCKYCDYSSICHLSHLEIEKEKPGDRDEIIAKMRETWDTHQTS